MESRTAIIVAIVVMASAMMLPSMDADIVDSEIFTYYDQLDENSSLIFKEVNKATEIDGDTKIFAVELKMDRLFDDTDSAKEYAEYEVRTALTALYFSNPMVPYIWDYPVKDVVVTPEIGTVAVEEQTSYIVRSVSFELSVPEGITSESMEELDKAIKDFKVSGSTDASKVKDIMETLDKVYFKEDEEGKISNIYSALVSRQTTSAGVSQAFTVLCKLNSIPVLTVSGDNILASDETLSFWNYVYLEGDVDGETKKSWYIVDSTYAVSTGIAGYLTEVSYDGKTYSMAAAHYADLAFKGEVPLTLPQLEKNSYVPVGGIPFLEQYGEMLLIAVIGVVIIGSMIYAVRKGIA
jgi:hypothetical protein